MTPDEYCQRKAAASGRASTTRFLFLSPKRRRAITALYAFCREVDDVVDETSDPQVAGAKLAWWRAEIANLAAGKAQHPVSLALAPFVEKFDITAARLNEIVDGMEMDLTQTRYLDWRALEHYCYPRRGVVGLLPPASSAIAMQHARLCEGLGIAFRSPTSSATSAKTHQEQDLLPMEDMRRFSVTPAEILQRRDSPRFKALMAFQAGRAQQQYKNAITGSTARGSSLAAPRPHHGGDLPARCSKRSRATAFAS